MINFEATLKALSECGVNFVVIGGYAATLHGSAYLTRDLDICYERTPENMKRLVSALRPYRPRLRGAASVCDCARSRPKKATTLLNVSTRLPKPAAALSAVMWSSACIKRGNLLHIQFPLWPEHPNGIEV